MKGRRALSERFDLGLDSARMKDPRDAQRQAATADEIFERLFGADSRRRWELQILADEVGMGKTYVALAVAFTLLERMADGKTPRDLEACYRKVVILTPPNASLLKKWYREVSEFVKRCVREEDRAGVGRWFAPVLCERLDDFVRALRTPGPGKRVIVAPMDIFGEKKLLQYDIKRRFLLGALFRYWGNRLQIDRRERLLRGSPADWPERPGDVSDLSAEDLGGIPCTEEEAIDAIRRLDRSEEGMASPIETLLEECRAISEPFVRNRDELFGRVSKQLSDLYRRVVLTLLGSPVPLVIVDEAHNWKNGPSSGANGYKRFAEYLASRTRRTLLLTATPFQLRPQEMLELLKIGEGLQCVQERAGAEQRRERFRKLREEVLEPVLGRADRASRHFARTWSKLHRVALPELEWHWKSSEITSGRQKIEDIAALEGIVPEKELSRVVGDATERLDPSLRPFFAAALTLFAHNRDLSCELGPVVVRHRRSTDHRVFRVGCEYGPEKDGAELRPDRHVLHAALGLDVRGAAELPHYLLMRCISDTKKGKGRSSLGSALTGCYSTLLESAEGRRIKDWLLTQAGAPRHFGLLCDLVDRREDPRHPKVAIVVDEVLRAWHEGEKSLLFCFRTNTAQRLHEIIEKRITQELNRRRQMCLGGEASLKALRGRLTRRDGDLIPLVLDRVLWSLVVTGGFGAGWPWTSEEVELQEEDISGLATVALRHGVALDEEKVDRVFLSRAVETVIARRLLRTSAAPVPYDVRLILRRMSESEWVEWPYGLEPDPEDDDGAGEDEGFEPRGVHARFPVKVEEPSEDEVRTLAARIEQRRTRAQTTGETSIVDVDAEGPSLWFGGAPRDAEIRSSELVRRIHEHLAELTKGSEGLDWGARGKILQGLRRTLLRASTLVRLLPSRAEREERAWGELLVDAFFQPVSKGQRESMADRIEVFLEDLCGASGDLRDQGSAKATLLEATRLRGQSFVKLVMGGDQKTRERVFAGFNTPLLPDVLVCTSVGAEGIDLHRHCRHVIHYDLAWNPAGLEQRTGRVDRIGSKTFRERALPGGADSMFLEVGVPFLAGTYDERMYEELRLRAQIFEVLTGGEVAADAPEEQDGFPEAEGKEEGYRLLALPVCMVEDMRVKLQVWSGEGDS